MNDKRFIFFLGKGGVGKTTISTAYALECAKKGKRTLLLSLHSSDKVERIFNKEISDRRIVRLRQNLYATTVTPEHALEEYGLLKLKVRFIYKAVFENKIVAAFLSTIPGLNDLVMLGKAYWHVIEKQNGKFAWDKVVVDAPATGHGIFFLQIPAVLSELLSSGNMYEEAQKMQAVLEDNTFTELNLITLAEEMPVNESLMMIDTARQKLKLPISRIIVNGVLPELFQNPEALRLIENANIELRSDAPLVDRLIEAARWRILRQNSQREQLLDINKFITAIIPYQFSKDLDLEMIESIADSLEQQLND